MQRPLSVAVFALAFAPVSAHAQWVQHFDEGSVRTEPNQRRADVTIGANLGVLGGAASGFPNEVAKIDVPQYEAETGFGAGSWVALWLGGALSDWLSFGIGGASGTLAGADGEASLGAFLFRVETYPLVGMGGALGDLGLFANAGLGTMTVEQDGKESGEGGSMSFLGAGVLWEAWRPGHFALGPSLEYMHLWSLTGTAHVAQLGFRVAYYGGPDTPAAAARK
jgi:hypothetical protein